MKKIALFAMFLSTLWGYSQVKNYAFTQSSGTYTEIIGGTVLGNESSDYQHFVDPVAPMGGSGETGVGLPIGFEFNFNGYVYDRFSVTADGYISLGSSTLTPSVNCAVNGYNTPLSSLYPITPVELSAKIAGLGKDLQAQTGASLTFKTIGVAPNRVLVVQWKKYRRYNIPGDDFNFQIRLNETSNTVSIVYGSFVNAVSGTVHTYQVGLRAEPTGVASNFANIKSTTGWGAAVAGTVATDAITMNDLLVPSSGLTFTWAPPTCGGAKGVVASSISTNGATLNWGSYLPVPNSYEYVVSTSETAPLSTVSGTATTNPTAVITNLNTNTVYNVFFRTKCGTEYTQWTLGGTFKTACMDAVTLFEDFDTYSGTTVTVLPDCWGKAGNGSVYVYGYGSSGAPMTAPNSLNMYAYAPAMAYAIMPPVSNLQAGTHRLRFKAYSSSGTDKTLDVGYFTNPSDPSTFVSLQIVNLPGTSADKAQQFIVTPVGVPVGVKSLVFKNIGYIYGLNIYIDDVIYEPIPACADVTATSVKEFTSTSVKASWTKGGSESEWQYVCAPSTVLNPNSLTPVDVSGATTSVTISGLTPATGYRVWIRSKCGTTNFGSWIGTLPFSTTCAPVAQFVENFDAATTSPACWAKMGTTGSAYVTSVPNAPSAPNALYMSSSSATNLATMALPPLSNTAAATHRLRFRAKGGTAGAKVDIGYFTDIADPNSYVYLQTVTVTSTTSFDTYIVGLGADPKSPYLAFRNPGTPFTNVYIDEVAWEPIPTCSDVSALAVTAVAGTTANITWTAGGSENEWQYVIGASTLKEPSSLTPVNVSEATASITGLLPVTNYKIWVRSKCSTTSLGAWMGPITFTTTCNSVAGFSQNFDASTTMPACWTKIGVTGDVYVASNSSAPTAPNALIIGTYSPDQPAICAMPPVSNSAAGTHRLKFKAKTFTVGGVLEVGYLMNFSDPTSFVSLYKYTATQSTAFESLSVELGLDPASDILAFRNAGAVSATFNIDNVIWEAIPTCKDISALAITESTHSTASVSWTKSGSETKWEYAIGSVSVIDPTTLTPVEVSSTMTTVSGLAPVTSYKIWIRSKCSGADLGAWVGPVLATTTCSPVTNFTEEFASASIPSCWSKVGTGGSAYMGELTDAPTKPYVLYLSSYGPTSQGIVSMPPISNSTAADYQLKFKYKGNTLGTALEVGYLTSPSNPDSFVAFKSVPITSTTDFQTMTVNLGPSQLSAVWAFRHTGAPYTNIYIDSVSWNVIPTTAPACATGITTIPDANCGNFATLISWSAVSGADGYKLTIGTTPGGSELLNNQDVSGVSYSIVGNKNTTYYYTVKPYNVIGSATGCAELTYVTNVNGCYCTSVPTGKDGTGVTNVQLGATNFVGNNVTYYDFTAKPINVAKGESTDLKLTFDTGSYVYNVAVYVDLNDNFTYESSEIFATGTSGTTSPNIVSTPFLLPATAALGTHNMRISTWWGSAALNPCFNGNYAVTIDLKVNVVAPVANDAPAGAVALIVGADFAANAITGTNTGATGTYQVTAPVCGGFNGMDVWYSAVVPSTGNLTFEVNTVSGGLTDTGAAAYSGTMSALTLLDCNDSGSAAGDNHPKITVTGKTPGEVLYLRVWENGGDAFGSFKVSAYSASLGVDAFDDINFSYYPNPVKDILNLSFNQEMSNVTVVNLLGQQVMSKSLNSNQGKIDMSGLSKGTYLVKVTVGNQSKAIKVVKE